MSPSRRSRRWYTSSGLFLHRAGDVLLFACGMLMWCRPWRPTHRLTRTYRNGNVDRSCPGDRPDRRVVVTMAYGLVGAVRNVGRPPLSLCHPRQVVEEPKSSYQSPDVRKLPLSAIIGTVSWQGDGPMAPYASRPLILVTSDDGSSRPAPGGSQICARSGRRVDFSPGEQQTSAGAASLRLSTAPSTKSIM